VASVGYVGAPGCQLPANPKVVWSDSWTKTAIYICTRTCFGVNTHLTLQILKTGYHARLRVLRAPPPVLVVEK